MKILLLIIASCLPMLAMEKAQGFCERGAAITVSPASVGGAPAARNFQQSFPRCTTTVYITGSGGTLATLYSDNGITPLANPFTADQFGLWAFYAANGHYDVQISGGTPPPALSVPYTFGDIILQDGFSITGPFDNSTAAAPLIGAVSANNATPDYVDQVRFWLSNALPNGFRPNGTTGFVDVPANSSAYEACAICGLALASGAQTNTVSISGFVGQTADTPNGVVNTSATLVTLVSGSHFNADWPTINGIITIAGMDYFIASVNPDLTHLTLTASAGVQTGVAYIKYIPMWGINTLCETGLPGLGTHQLGGWCLNEFDFNSFHASTKIIAGSIGGNGSAQPISALGWTCNGLGTGLFWDTCFGSLPGATRTFASISPQSYDPNSQSQNVIFFSYDAAGFAHGSVMYQAAGGSWNHVVNFINQGAPSAATWNWLDGDSFVLMGLHGTEEGDRPRLQMGNQGSMQPAADTLANITLSGLSSGEMIFCNNCKNSVSNPGVLVGAACVSGGAGGAMAIGKVGFIACY